MRKVYYQDLPYGKTLKIEVNTTLIQDAKFGWCPPEGKSIPDMLSVFPNTKVIRIFLGPKEDLPEWENHEDLKHIPKDVDVILSFKKHDIDRVVLFADSIPKDRTGFVYLCYHHEPEQGESKGDPPYDVWADRWLEIGRVLGGHPNRGMIKLTPILTGYYQYRNDWRFWIPWDAWHNGYLDAIGMDVYNKDISMDTYHQPAALFARIKEISQELDLPYLIAEMGTERIASDSDGKKCASWMHELARYLRLDGGCVAMAWFYYGGNDFIKTNRHPEQDALKYIIEHFN